MTWKKLILLGDSNTQSGFSRNGHWVSDLADALQRKCDVINRGFSGYSTRHIRSLLPGLMSEFDPQSVCGMTLMLGSNDSTKPQNTIQHVPLEEYRQNMQFIIDYLINWGVDRKKLILINPPRINDTAWAERQSRYNEEPTHFDHLVKDYAKVSVEVAVEKDIPFVDLNKLMYDCGDTFTELLHDGLHFSSKGSDLLFRNLYPLINENIENTLNFNYPYWKDFQPNQAKFNA